MKDAEKTHSTTDLSTGVFVGLPDRRAHRPPAGICFPLPNSLIMSREVGLLALMVGFETRLQEKQDFIESFLPLRAMCLSLDVVGKLSIRLDPSNLTGLICTTYYVRCGFSCCFLP